MKLEQLLIMMSHPNLSQIGKQVGVARYAAMVGYDLPELHRYDGWVYTVMEATDIPADVAAKILSLDYAERQTENLAEMGRQMGKINVSVPSNINVWQHLKGEAPLRDAANSLSEAAKLLAEKVAQ